MDFILSLTHFCEVHGPTSILCSQAIPTACAQCVPDPSDLSSTGTPLSSHHDSPSLAYRSLERTKKKSSHEPVTPPDLPPVVASSVGCTAPSTDLDSPPLSPPVSAPPTGRRMEDLPSFLSGSFGISEAEALNRFGAGEGDTCQSCRLSIPEDVSKQLPPGAPGTMKEDGKARNGSPVLRSREMVHSCSGNHSEHDESQISHNPQQQSSSSPSSVRSVSTSSETSSCHPHVVTYLSLRGPPSPTDYALLRRASIRTLSCELLPRGLSSGPLSFGDSVAGYTVAYVFRLPDSTARGKRRSYALVALAGKDSGRAFRACPVIWRIFGRIASSLIAAAERQQEREKRQEEGSKNDSTSSTATTTTTNNSSRGPNTINGRAFTPVSSFLTGRAVDLDGQPRRAGQVRARNLTEIVGNESIFAELHAQFAALLQQLGGMFGGVRVPDPRSVPSGTTSEQFDENGEQYFATSTHGGGSGDGTKQSPVHLSPAPKPIPISQRRRVVA